MARAQVGRRLLRLAAVLAVGLLGGCAARAVRPSLDLRTALAVRDAYVASTPARMQAVQSVVMSWRRRPLTALGWLRYDRERASYALVGLSPTGATLFSLSEAGGEAAGSFAALPGGDPKAWIAAMAGDIRRIYFDGVPRPDDGVGVRGGAVVVTRRLADDGELRLELAQAPMRSRAEWRRGGRRVGTTLYEEYETHGGLSVPLRIVHTNQVYGYQLVIRTQEIQSLESPAPASGGGTPP